MTEYYPYIIIIIAFIGMLFTPVYAVNNSSNTYIFNLLLQNMLDVSINNPINNQVLTYNGTYWVNKNATGGGGDNLGNHKATQTLNMTGNDIINIGSLEVEDEVYLQGDITPPQITAQQNDYNPTGLSDAITLRLSTDARRSITGIAGGTDGRVLIITNVGSNAIQLVDESTNSIASNRFAITEDLIIQSEGSVILQYDSTSSRWRMIAEYVPDVLRGSGSSIASGRVITWQQLTADSADVTTTTLSSSVMTTTGLGSGTTWHFRYLVYYQSASAGNGIGFGVDYTGTESDFHASGIVYPTTTSAISASLPYTNTINAIICCVTISVETANTSFMAIIEGTVTTTSGGQLELKIASENSGTAVRLKAGSLLELHRIS